MLLQQTLTALKHLKLTGMAQALEEQMAQPATQTLGFEERLGLLLYRELLSRDTRRLTRLLQLARLKHNAALEDLVTGTARGLDRALVGRLASCGWIRHGQAVIVTGATGTGKTWLACALGHQACRSGLTVRYLRVPRLFDELRISHGDGSFPRRLSQLAKIDLLILDDWGLKPLTAPDRNDLLEILDDRAGVRATLLTSQMPVAHWHEYLGDPQLADAILDRIVHSAHKVELKGESMRKVRALLTARDQIA